MVVIVESLINKYLERRILKMKYLKIKAIAVSLFLAIVIFSQATNFSAPPLANLYGHQTYSYPNSWVCACPEILNIDCACIIYR